MVADNDMMSESDFSMQGDGPQGMGGSMSPPLGGLMIRSDGEMMGGPPGHPSLFCSRKQREFTPDSKKDDTYWDRRRRNNAAAKRSREKRRLNDMLLEKRVVQLARENHILRAQVTSVFKSYGIRAETLIDMDQVLATLPTEDQLLQSAGCGPSIRSESPPPLEPEMTMTIGNGISPHHDNTELLRFDEIYRQQFSQHREQQRPGCGNSPNDSSDSGHPSTSSGPTSTTSGSGQGSPVHPGSHSTNQGHQEQPSEPQVHQPQQLAVDFSKRPETDEDDRDSSTSGSIAGSKRSYPMAWDHERRTGSSNSGSSSGCEDSGSIMGDDPINLTTFKSRSRSSSENEQDSDQDLRHHIPHKMRYKYLQPQHMSADQSQQSPLAGGMESSRRHQQNGDRDSDY